MKGRIGGGGCCKSLPDFFPIRGDISGRKKCAVCDPVVAGVGISTFDMPFLVVKYREFQVAPPEEIYETLCKLRVVDLATVGIGLFQISRPVLHPYMHNE